MGQAMQSITEVQDRSALTGWGGAKMANAVRETQYMKDAKTFLDELNGAVVKLREARAVRNMSRSDRNSIECYRAVLWWLKWLDGKKEEPTHPDWEENDLIELLEDYSLAEGGAPTPAARWCLEWLADGPPDEVNPKLTKTISPKFIPRRAASSYKRPH